MNAGQAALRVSQLTAVLMVLGWIAVVYTAIFVPGGHPPPSAFVGAGVIIGSWVLGTVGLIAGLVSLAQKQSRRKVVLLFVYINAGLFAFAILVNFM